MSWRVYQMEWKRPLRLGRRTKKYLGIKPGTHAEALAAAKAQWPGAMWLRLEQTNRYGH